MSERITDRNSESETVFAKGKLFELIHKKQPDGRIFEVARRAPGVRLIIADRVEEKILLTREFRSELNDWDYRLPGGKVFDSLDEYESNRSTESNIESTAFKKAKEESVEEAGIIVDDLSLYKKSILGATVEWDLYVFEVGKWDKADGGQRLEYGEQIETDNWFSYSDVQKLILDGDMQEERIALILLRWIKKEKERNNEV